MAVLSPFFFRRIRVDSNVFSAKEGWQTNTNLYATAPSPLHIAILFQLTAGTEIFCGSSNRFFGTKLHSANLRQPYSGKKGKDFVS